MSPAGSVVLDLYGGAFPDGGLQRFQQRAGRFGQMILHLQRGSAVQGFQCPLDRSVNSVAQGEGQPLVPAAGQRVGGPGGKAQGVGQVTVDTQGGGDGGAFGLALAPRPPLRPPSVPPNSGGEGGRGGVNGGQVKARDNGAAGQAAQERVQPAGAHLNGAGVECLAQRLADATLAGEVAQ